MLELALAAGAVGSSFDEEALEAVRAFSRDLGACNYKGEARFDGLQTAEAVSTR